MKIIHTSDWHLGCALDYYSREYEHRCFLDFLERTVKTEQVDALIVAGDIFDTANPAVDSQKMLYSFLIRLYSSCPQLQVILTAGNHDSASRLGVAGGLLEFVNCHAVTRVEFEENGRPLLERLVFPLKDHSGKICAFCGAVPFIRRADLPAQYAEGEHYHEDPFANAVYALHRQLLELMKGMAQNGEKLIVIDHTAVAGGSIREEDSEHQIAIGSLESIPADLFDGFDYAALGHIHKYQKITEGPCLSVYSGSPIPVSFAEINYHNGFELITIDDSGALSQQHIEVPRTVQLQRIPQQAQELDEVIRQLEQLPEKTADSESDPFIEVQFLSDGFEPRALEKIKAAVADRAVRLFRVERKSRNTSQQSGDEQSSGITAVEVERLDPVSVFSRFYRSQTGSDSVPEELSREFMQILDEVRQNEQ